MANVIFNRRKANLFTSWWWTVDRLTFFSIMAMVAVGSIMVTTASPAVAERIGLESFYFVQRQIIFSLLAVGVLFTFSLFSPLTVRRFATLAFIIGIVFLVAVLFFGAEAKGAKRWLDIAGFSIQPSEFMKPIFIVLTAWMLAESKQRASFQGIKISVALYLILVALLMAQPDLGMTLIISMVWMGQLFIAGLPLFWVAAFVTCVSVGILGAYAFFPHVTYRIDSFLASLEGGGESYQVRKSLEAFSSGGFFGKGPGEGVVKQYVPDSHTDFIFAVAGEEFGALVCICMVGLYAFVVLRGLRRLMGEKDIFIVYAVAGLLIQFGVQSAINMGVTLNLLPTKGMTLPFISYGGSSILAISMAMGMMLALTRRRYGVMAPTDFARVRVTG